MHITITLPDPRYCDGCPCKQGDNGNEDETWCAMQYWSDMDEDIYATDDGRIYILRPAKCREENGE